MFAPLAGFSPEWQAVRWAFDHGATVEAIDLPLALSLARDADDGELPMRRGGGPPVDPLGDLAAAAGEPDAERWWEDLVEHRGDGETVFDAVGEAMAAVRAGTFTPTFDIRREAHMRRRIRAALADDRIVAVVCGAWHVPALDPSVTTDKADAADAPRPAEGEGRRHLGARGPIAGSAGPRATAPASPAPVGTPTCSTTPARKACRASSSTPPTRCAAAASRRRPTT